MNDVDNQWPIKLATAHGPKICTSVQGKEKKRKKRGVGVAVVHRICWKLILHYFHKEPIEMLFIAFLQP